MKVLFATAELAPLVRVGGLAAAAAGLVDELRRQGVDVEVALPDYSGLVLLDEQVVDLDVPAWAAPARARRGHTADGLDVTLVDVPGIWRPHPYLQPSGEGWWDNDERFFRFSAAVAALARSRRPDVLHLNDWHTASALAHLDPAPPTMLTIHTLGYQGTTNAGWLPAFAYHRSAFEWFGAVNPLVGAIRLADVVVAVSPTYAREILTPEGGFGVEGVLRERGESLVGILNGIDTTAWDPATDPHLPVRYDRTDLAGKDANRAALRAELGLPEMPGALAVVVSRLVDQKGIDLVLPLLPLLERLPMQLAVLGDGDAHLADALAAAAAAAPDRVAFSRGYDEALAHRLFAGGDLFVMPSRFEPCGLAQMQAMRYGALPVVTDVGGLHDTVVDVDANPSAGTGVTAARPTSLDLLDALHRAARAHANRPRRDAMRRRGMAIDWSWREPASAHVELYRRIAGASAPGG
ncbi:MAG: glycosyltransferase [Actinobacteria bacterium]|uniref:starch synthase n=1 Tax=freshwater metagenome TaxID=449393 RepID=A0A6J6ECL2_9ZZZZ|nr:glycosyltransferase [Actinomycetota bacterium]